MKHRHWTYFASMMCLFFNYKKTTMFRGKNRILIKKISFSCIFLFLFNLDIKNKLVLKFFFCPNYDKKYYQTIESQHIYNVIPCFWKILKICMHTCMEKGQSHKQWQMDSEASKHDAHNYCSDGRRHHSWTGITRWTNNHWKVVVFWACCFFHKVCQKSIMIEEELCALILMNSLPPT